MTSLDHESTVLVQYIMQLCQQVRFHQVGLNLSFLDSDKSAECTCGGLGGIRFSMFLSDCALRIKSAATHGSVTAVFLSVLFEKAPTRMLQVCAFMLCTYSVNKQIELMIWLCMYLLINHIKMDLHTENLSVFKCLHPNLLNLFSLFLSSKKQLEDETKLMSMEYLSSRS